MIKIWCSLPSMLCICCHTFRKWWRSLLDYYYNICSECVYFNAHNEINVSYILLNDMIKNQEAVLLKKHKYLSRLLYLLEFTLNVVTDFEQFLHTLYCSPITAIISFKDINRDSIWCNWEGPCWHYIFRFWSSLGISVKTF